MSGIRVGMNRDAGELLNALADPALAEDARSLQNQDMAEDFKNEVVGFFKNRIAAISRAERIKELVFRELENDIQGGALNFDQKMTVLMRLARDNNESADSIISLFRNSAQAGGSPLGDLLRAGGEKPELARAFENYTPEQLHLINNTAKILRDIVESGGNAEIHFNGGEGCSAGK